MKLFARLWTTVTYVTNWLTLSPFDVPGAQQHPIFGVTSNNRPILAPPDYPIFKPPGGRLDGPGSDFACNYSRMLGWYDCSTLENRECWLRNPDGREYNIHTNCENHGPIGIDRNYTLIVNDGIINADGQDFVYAKVFNNSFPGPWIQACWGDRVNINVINNLTFNGTAIHWHGIRQFKSMHMDGVSGITQCPIAPGDNFTYTWNTTQYGSSWYHSHYSVQYADGLQGPIADVNLDNPWPILITLRRAETSTANDRLGKGHYSAFNAVYTGNVGNASILLNGVGNLNRFSGKKLNTSIIPPIYQLHFEKKEINPIGRAKRYLLRLINTSFDSTFIFSIDNHWLRIVGADFVPIEPYYNTTVLIGIGQRYHVIVEADPVAGDKNPLQPDGNYWIRTWVADTCGKKGTGADYEKNGILRYNDTSTSDPNSTQWPLSSFKCSDETYSSLKPIVPWYIGNSSNGKDGEEFDVTLFPNNYNNPKFPLAIFSLEPQGASGFTPLQVDYDNPIFLHLDDFSGKWPDRWVVVPENYTSTDWVFLAITGTGRKKTYNAHPIHLHGHDFAILQQVEGVPYDPDLLNLNLINPPRRDVVLLPTNGFVVIAFRTDNPGNWLMHCHIAYHASGGLDLQILERQNDANNIWPHGSSEAIKRAEQVCANWDAWNKCENWWPGFNKTSGNYPACVTKPWLFQDDSGV